MRLLLLLELVRQQVILQMDSSSSGSWSRAQGQGMCQDRVLTQRTLLLQLRPCCQPSTHCLWPQALRHQHQPLLLLLLLLALSRHLVACLTRCRKAVAGVGLWELGAAPPGACSARCSRHN
jgi:hypothetical protein